MTPFRRRSIALAVPLLGLSLVAGDAVAAQEAGDGEAATRPSHVHEGTCDALIGPDFVILLSDLEVPAGEALGEEASVAAAEPVAVAFTVLNASLEELLDAPHAIDVHRSEEDEESFVACGEIAGRLGRDGGLAVALTEQGGSGYAGVVFLAPTAANVNQTAVSVLLVEPPVDDAAATQEAAAEGDGDEEAEDGGDEAVEDA